MPLRRKDATLPSDNETASPESASRDRANESSLLATGFYFVIPPPIRARAPPVAIGKAFSSSGMILPGFIRPS